MINTLREAKKLDDAGFGPEQASAIVDIQFRSPSWVLRNLERSGFERGQALAVLDYFWSVRNESLCDTQCGWDSAMGTVMSPCMFGILYIFSNLTHLDV
jgi:hypothetical protein